MSKRFLAGFLAILLLVSLSACGSADHKNEGELFREFYKANHTPVFTNDGIKAACFLNGQAFYISRSYTDRWDTVYAVDADGVAAPVPCFEQYQSKRGKHDLYSLQQLIPVDEKTLLIVEICYINAIDSYLDQTRLDCRVLTLDLEAETAEEAVQETILAASASDEVFRSVYRDSAGNLYSRRGGSGIAVWDAAGNALSRVAQGNDRYLLTLKDGRVACLSASQTDNGLILQPIDPETRGLQKEYSIAQLTEDNTGLSFYNGFGAYDFYCNTGISLYGYRLNTETMTAEGEILMTWLNCDVEGAAVLNVGENREGQISCVSYSSAYDGDLAEFTKEKASDGEATTLTLACRGLEQSVAQLVLRFNRQNNGYRVEIRDYGAAAVNNGLAAGLDQMAVDMISGNAPDLFCTDGMDIQSLISLNLLEDLWPYIDADTGLGGRQGVVEPVFNAMSRDGKLYEVTSGFIVRTAAGMKALLGEREGWTLREFLDFYETLDDCPAIFDWYIYRERATDIMVELCGESFIDRQTNTAHFDSQEFLDLLEYLTLFPENAPDPSYQERKNWCLEGRQPVQALKLFTAFDYVESPYGSFGIAPTTYAGYPGVAGNGAAYQIETPIAMCTQCANKEGAWQFLRMMLLPENQPFTSQWDVIESHPNFPTNKAVYNLMMQDAMTDKSGMVEDGVMYPGKISLYSADGNEVLRQPMTQQQADDLWNYLENITVVWRQEENLSAILKEEISRFLAGQQDANAAANAAQSRVQLYLDERN